MNTKDRNAEIEMRELESAAIHEAGHLVVLKALGGRGYIRLCDGDPSMGEKRWSGTTVITQQPRSSLRRADIYVGLAGVMAEMIHAGAVTFDQVDVSLFSYPDADGISDTDAAAIRQSTQRDLKITHKHLIQNWDEVLEKAQGEIRKATGDLQDVEPAPQDKDQYWKLMARLAVVRLLQGLPEEDLLAAIQKTGDASLIEAFKNPIIRASIISTARSMVEFAAQA